LAHFFTPETVGAKYDFRGRRNMTESLVVTAVLTACYLLALVFIWLPR
jgi:hypothetical protein